MADPSPSYRRPDTGQTSASARRALTSSLVDPDVRPMMNLPTSSIDVSRLPTAAARDDVRRCIAAKCIHQLTPLSTGLPAAPVMASTIPGTDGESTPRSITSTQSPVLLPPTKDWQYFVVMVPIHRRLMLLHAQ